MAKVKLVFAVGFQQKDEYPFGYEQGLPWGHCREDLQNFKRVTKDSVLIMGAQTFRSLPGKLPGRLHVVLSDSGSQLVTKNGDRPDMVINGGSLSNALCALKETYPDKDISVIGGKRMIEEVLTYSLADEVHLTFMKPHWRVELPYDVAIELTPIVNMNNNYLHVAAEQTFVEHDTISGFIYETWKKK